MKVLTFDLETQNYTHNKRKASPFDQRNYIVEAGWNWNGGKVESQRWDAWHRDDIMVEQFDALEKGDIINGFNIKFDLLWVWQQDCVQNALKRGVTIYCGQYVEYLLGGHQQEVQMTAMNNIAEKYGGGCKIDAVKEMWEEGYLTSEIPPDLLHDYLCGDGKEIVGDVMNTWLIFCGQIAHMKANHPKEFRTMLKFRMDGLLATTEMEFNGVYVDTVKGEELRTELVKDLEVASEELESFIPELPPELNFNWASNVHKSCLIFGGTVKYEKWLAHTDSNNNVLYAKKTEKWPLFNNIPIPPPEVIKAGTLYVMEVPEGTPKAFTHKEKYYIAQDTFKSGKRAGEGKTKNVKVDDLDKPKGAKKPHYFKFDGYVKPHGAWKAQTTDAYDNPLYSTGAKVIDKLAKRGLAFTDALVKRTALDKDLGTYYWKEDKHGKRKGMLTLADEGIIHHKLNHTSTVTSRLSSSDPNLQNVPRGDTSNVKKMFSSRHGEQGRMAEIDYSQLEVVVQGVLSGDPTLQQDLRDRVDFHCKRLAAKLGEDYQHVWDMCHVVEDPEYKKGRTGAKIFSFQRAYGAGADTIANETGMPRSEVDALIEAENKLYPMVQQFDSKLEQEIIRNRIPTASKLFIEGVAFTQGESHWDSPTGTRYVWKEGIAPEFLHQKGKYTGFSPTERKNYPVQGFGGEIVQTMMGVLYRHMLSNNHYNNQIRLVNTVHDCFWFDATNEKVLADAIPELLQIIESVPQVFNKAFDTLDINVPFPAEAEMGKDMYDMEVVH